jgi:hypothetical protein
MVHRVSPPDHPLCANRLDVGRAEPPNLRTVLEARQQSFLRPESYRTIGDAESDRDGVHRQDTFAVRCKRVHVTFLEAGGWGRTELSPAGGVAEVLKKASKHAECLDEGS